MPEILGAKAGKLSYMDALLIAGTKIVSERLLATVVGNGSLVSGATKMIGAGFVDKFVSNKYGSIITTALVVDGAEDVVLSFLPQISGGFLGNKQTTVEVI